MRIKPLLFALALAGSINGHAETSEQSDFEIEGVKFRLEQKWKFQKIKEVVPSWRNTQDYNCEFFVCEGRIYFVHQGYDFSTGSTFHTLNCIDAETGEFLDRYTIAWGDIPHNDQYAAFCGTDSEGTPYIVSNWTYNDEDNNVFDPDFYITVLEIEQDGKPQPVKTYNVSRDCFEGGRYDNYFVRSPRVSGSLMDGNFSFGALFWKLPSRDWYQKATTDWSDMAIVEFANSEFLRTTFISSAKHDHSHATVMPLSSGLCLINSWASDWNTDRIDTDYSRPTLYDYFQDKAVASIEADALGTDSPGLDIFRLSGHEFLFCPDGNLETPGYFLFHIPAYNETFTTSKAVIHLDGAEENFVPVKSLKTGDFTDNMNCWVRAVECKPTARDGEAAVDLYMFSRCEGMACYTLKAISEPTTSIEDVKAEIDGPTTYYNLQGQPVGNHSGSLPSGIYIRSTPAGAAKIRL